MSEKDKEFIVWLEEQIEYCLYVGNDREFTPSIDDVYFECLTKFKQINGINQ